MSAETRKEDSRRVRLNLQEWDKIMSEVEALKPEQKRLSTAEGIRMMKATLSKKFREGCSPDQLLQILKSRGIDMTIATLQRYLKNADVPSRPKRDVQGSRKADQDVSSG